MPTFEQFGRVVRVEQERPGITLIHLTESGVESRIRVRTSGIRDQDSANRLPRKGARIIFRRRPSLSPAWCPDTIDDGMSYALIGEYCAVEDIFFLRHHARSR